MHNRRLPVVIAGIGAVALFASPAHAMHIAEGILPPAWAGLWFAASAPFVLWGLIAIRQRRTRDSKYMPMLAMVGAAVFLISCMPIPIPVAGSCSHPCGTGLAAVLVGPAASIVVATVALAFQALFMAHGGLSTLGANIFAMGVLGSLVGWGAFGAVRRMTGSIIVAAVAAGLLSDWATYAGTSFILASALHGQGSMWPMFGAIAVAFMPTQIPLGVLEGALTAWAYAFISRRRPELTAAGVATRALAHGVQS
jgi:cobalt/nickel transport system permease protein